jgi:catechol 2,3-dioxygenase-like lactoylglutathione lyase family enzyme
MMVKHLDHINMTVDDVDASADWYRRVFGFERVEGGLYDGEPWAILRAGDALLCIYQAKGRKVPGDAELERHRHHGMAHFGLRITDRAAFERILEREQVKVTYGEYRYPHSTSWYVLDPSGYEIEVACWDDDRVRFPA